MSQRHRSKHKPNPTRSGHPKGTGAGGSSGQRKTFRSGSEVRGSRGAVPGRHTLSRQGASAQKSGSGPRTSFDSRGGRAYPPGRWVIGLHSAREALKQHPKLVGSIWLREDHVRSLELTEFAKWGSDQGVRVEACNLTQLDRFGTGHQGVAIQMLGGPLWDESLIATEGSIVILILDGIQDPHNLGAILRSAWLMGVKAVFIPQHRSSPLTPVAMKVASGAAEHVPVVEHESLPELLKDLKKQGFWTYGLAAESAANLWQVSYPKRVALVVGGEGKGLRVTVARSCDELVAIPQIAPGASFNASVATAIALAEVVRQAAQAMAKKT